MNRAWVNMHYKLQNMYAKYVHEIPKKQLFVNTMLYLKKNKKIIQVKTERIKK